MTFDFNEKDFLLDGKPYYLMSGTIHYFRVPREYWHDRLLKLKECGFNAVETYTAWNLHEPKEGVFDFSGELDIEEFILTAKRLGLKVILRPGPYICAEWELGGLPSYLLKYNIPLRCYNEEFLKYVDRYYENLFNIVRPHLITNGGNIIMLQVENEYGSYGNDKAYLNAVVDIYKKHNMDCLYFTSDGSTLTLMNGGTLPEHLVTSNFGSNPKGNIEFLQNFRKDQPYMCMEYWCGWFDHWFEEHHTRQGYEVIDDLKWFIEHNVNFNMYMFHGGTNFGFTNGANHMAEYEPTTTSYDYCAPLSEAGDRTETYYLIRNLIKEKFGAVPEITATETPKKAYGKIKLTQKAELFDNLDNLSTPVKSVEPLFMEALDQDFGYILYSANINGPRDEQPLFLDTLHDRANIFLNEKPQAIYFRNKPVTKENALRLAFDYNESARLDILVENMGRINYGPLLKDQKGINGLRFGNQYHFGYDIYTLPMNNLEKLEFSDFCGEEIKTPVFLKGEFEIADKPSDTFIKLTGFNKGFVTVNGKNIGRYFNEAGPQLTLYLPAPYLKKGKNEIIVFESDGKTNGFIELMDNPEFK